MRKLAFSAFDRVVALNLTRRADRRQGFEARVQAMIGGWPHRPPEIVAAVDGAALPCPYWFKQGAGAYGCWRSHVNILERALADGLESLLVFEDDAVFDANYSVRIEEFLRRVPQTWQLLFPGGEHLGRTRRVAPGVLRCENVHRTHAYALRGRESMQQLYALWTEWPLRNPEADFHCDWLLGPWCAVRRTYAPEPFLVIQAPGVSDIAAGETSTTIVPAEARGWFTWTEDGRWTPDGPDAAAGWNVPSNQGYVGESRRGEWMA